MRAFAGARTVPADPGLLVGARGLVGRDILAAVLALARVSRASALELGGARYVVGHAIPTFHAIPHDGNNARCFAFSARARFAAAWR